MCDFSPQPALTEPAMSVATSNIEEAASKRSQLGQGTRQSRSTKVDKSHKKKEPATESVPLAQLPTYGPTQGLIFETLVRLGSDIIKVKIFTEKPKLRRCKPHFLEWHKSQHKFANLKWNCRNACRDTSVYVTESPRQRVGVIYPRSP